MAYGYDEKPGDRSGRRDEIAAPELAHLARLIAPLVSDDRGKIHPTARLAVELRTQEGRHALLDPLIAMLVPPNMSSTLWQHWLRGGRPPMTKGDVPRISAPGKAQSQKLSKAGARVTTAAKRVDRMRKEVEEAEAQLDRERQIETALLQQAVSMHLVEALAPMFALGPASVIMRAIREEIDEDEIAVEMTGVAPAKYDREMEVLLEERKAGTRTIHEGLVRHGQNGTFRLDLRNVIQGTIERYDEAASEVTGIDRPTSERRRA